MFVAALGSALYFYGWQSAFHFAHRSATATRNIRSFAHNYLSTSLHRKSRRILFGVKRQNANVNRYANSRQFSHPIVCDMFGVALFVALLDVLWSFAEPACRSTAAKCNLAKSFAKPKKLLIT